MHQYIDKNIDTYLPEHIQPALPEHLSLKSAIDAAGLSHIWDMMLTLDYSTSDIEDLPAEKQDEFLNIMWLLLKSIDR